MHDVLPQLTCNRESFANRRSAHSTTSACPSQILRYSVSSSAPRCAAHNQSGQNAARSHDSELSAQQWIKQTKKLQESFVKRTIRVRNKCNQNYVSVHGGLKSLGRKSPGLGRIGNSISKAQENANAVLNFPSSLPSDVLTHLQELLPGLIGLQERIQANAKQSWRDYENALSEHPMRTKALTSCVGLTVADLIAQLAEGGAFDVLRTFRMASFGLLWHGISAHVWYMLLDKHVMADKASSTRAIVTKMVLDQAIWAPINTALFYAYLAMAEGHLSSIPDTLQAKLLPTIFAGYALWPLAHLINFKYIPSSQRLLYINVVNMFWTVYLSGMANSSVPVDPVQSQVQKFGLAIPVSHSGGRLPPSMVQPPVVPPIVQL